MEKMSFKPIGSGSEIYSDQFSREGWFIEVSLLIGYNGCKYEK